MRPRNPRSVIAVLFVVAGLALIAHGWRKLDAMPDYSAADLDLAAELNLSLDLARMPRDRQPDDTELPALRRAVRAEVVAGIERERGLNRSWIQTGLVLIGMGVLQALIQRRFGPLSRPR